MKKTILFLALMFSVTAFSQAPDVSYNPSTGDILDQLGGDVNNQTFNVCGNGNDGSIGILQVIGGSTDLIVEFENTTLSTTTSVTFTSAQLNQGAWLVVPDFTFPNWITFGESGTMRFLYPNLTAEIYFNNTNTIDITNIQNQFLVCQGDSLQYSPSGALNIDSFNVFSFITGTTYTPDTSGFINLPASVYQTTVYNSNGCSKSFGFDVIQSPPPNFNVTFTNPSGCGALDGQILLNSLTGDSLYCVGYDQDTTSIKDIYIADQSGTITLDSLGAGTYSNFMVQNSLGCTAYDSTTIITLVDPDVIDPIVTASIFTLCTNALDSSILEVVNASSYDSITWIPVNASNPYITFTAGSYYAEVVDTNNCEGVSNVIDINEVAPLVPVVSSSLDSICVDINQSSTLEVNNIADFSSIAWMPTNAANPYETFTGGLFYAEVTDINGCNNVSDTLEVVELIECDPSASIYSLSIEKVVSVEYYTLLGQKVEHKKKGLYIEVSTYQNGNNSTRQIFMNN
jgi:hypothetical protein